MAGNVIDNLRKQNVRPRDSEPVIDPPALARLLRSSVDEGYASGPCRILVKDGKPVVQP
jgi:hypothetical protein